MLSVHDKTRFHSLLRPVADSLGSRGITTIQIRLLSTILVVAVAVTILIWPRFHWPLLLVPVVLFVRMLLHVIEGMLTSEPGSNSRPDSVFNELWDLATETILYLPFATVASVSLMAIFTVVCLNIIGEIIRIAAMPIGYGRRYDLPMRKGGMALVFGFLGLLLGLDLTSAWLSSLLWIVAGLLVVTMLNRVWGMLSSGRVASE